MKKPINVMYDSGLDKLERRAIECALNLVYHLIGFKRGIIKYGNGARFGKKHLDADGYLDALLAGGRRAVSASELLDEISDQHAVNLFFTAKPFCDAKFGATNEFATVQSVLAYREGLSTEERILAIKGTLWHEHFVGRELFRPNLYDALREWRFLAGFDYLRKKCTVCWCVLSKMPESNYGIGLELCPNFDSGFFVL